MNVLTVTAHLENGISARDAWSPAFDGILAYHMLLKQLGSKRFREESAAGIQSTCENLPLLKVEEKDVWWWACSSPKTDITMQINRQFYKKFNIEQRNLINQKASCISLTKGQLKNYSLNFKHVLCKSIEWVCIGDEAELREILNDVHQVGANRGKGIGFVKSWVIEERGEGNNAKYNRPLPFSIAKNTGVVMEWGFRPSVRLNENRAECVMPYKINVSSNEEKRTKFDTHRTAKGDVWQLGKHRLMCGDSTEKDDVERLMNGEIADITFTSPPYNIGSEGDSKYIEYDDCKTELEYRSFLNVSVHNALNVSDYVFFNIQSLANNKLSLIGHIYDMRHKYADVIIWDKKSAPPAKISNVLNRMFEYIYVFSNFGNKKIGRKEFKGTLSNIVSVNSHQDKSFSKIHKATFPQELSDYFVLNFSELSVYDPFSGTGTVLISCEKLGRKCFAIEMSPIYCDIIVRRWQDLTGCIAKRIG